MKIFDEHGKQIGEIEKPGPVEHDGKWWEPATYRLPLKDDICYLPKLNVYRSGGDATAPRWIMHEIPTPTPEQLRATGDKLDGDRPRECRVGETVWNGMNWFGMAKAGTYRWHLVKADPAKATREKTLDKNCVLYSMCPLPNSPCLGKSCLRYKPPVAQAGKDIRKKLDCLDADVCHTHGYCEDGKKNSCYKPAPKVDEKALQEYVNDKMDKSQAMQPMPDITQDKNIDSDMAFIARMLHTSVVANKNNTDFHVCEAWEIAKKYLEIPAAQPAPVKHTTQADRVVDMHIWPCPTCGAKNWGESGNLCKAESVCAADDQRIADHEREHAGKDEGHTSCKGCKRAVIDPRRNPYLKECGECTDHIDNQERKNWTPQPPKGEDVQTEPAPVKLCRNCGHNTDDERRVYCEGCGFENKNWTPKVEDAPVKDYNGLPFPNPQPTAMDEIRDLCNKLGRGDNDSVCTFIRDLHRRSDELKAAQDARDMWSRECGLMCDALADLTGVPRDPRPGWKHCIEKIKSDLHRRSEANERNIKSSMKLDSIIGTCLNLGMRPGTVIDHFISDLHRRAGGFTVDQISEWMESSRGIFDLDDEKTELLKMLNDPQDGIKAVTERNEQQKG